MSVRVFCGPTISLEDVERQLPGASVAGPAALGDVLTAYEQGFAHIAIVDGYFDQRQPVWHKEILWALHHGVCVYGAASMGALRAAELAPFGMRGVGRIFELFLAGWLERDDEVAIAHASADEGYRALTDALINMRFTFRNAARDGVVSLTFAEHCTEIAEQTFYAERSYASVLASVGRSPERAALTASLRCWLEPSRGNRVDQKREDARDLLELLAQTKQADLLPPEQGPEFHFANTHAWNELRRSRASTR